MSQHDTHKPASPPPEPPRIFLLLGKPWVRLLLLLLLLLVAPFLVLWRVLGWLFTRQPLIVAAISIAVTWTLYLCIPGIPVTLLDWPLVFTTGYILILVTSVTLRGFHLGIWLALALYAIIRAAVFHVDDHEDTKRTLVNVLAVLGCVCSLWLVICVQHLWLPADGNVLEDVEMKIYSKYIVTEFSAHVVAGLGTVHVPYCGKDRESPPRTLVLVHGYLAGNAYWAANLQELARHFDVYAVEWKGIGRSIRPRFRPKTEQEIDDFFVESLEVWRRAVQVDRFILAGHSMGAIYTSYYADKYPQHVEHLVLVSPAGVTASPLTPADISWLRRLLIRYSITPMSVVRYTGPFGPRLVRWAIHFRMQRTVETNIVRSGNMNMDDIALYTYHNWALKKSGELACHTDLRPGGTTPRRPLCEVLAPARIRVSLSVLYGGSNDWMDPERGQVMVQRIRDSGTSYATFALVPNAGHQVFMDNTTDFNHLLVDAIHKHGRAMCS